MWTGVQRSQLQPFYCLRSGHTLNLLRDSGVTSAQSPRARSRRSLNLRWEREAVSEGGMLLVLLAHIPQTRYPDASRKSVRAAGHKRVHLQRRRFASARIFEPLYHQSVIGRHAVGSKVT